MPFLGNEHPQKTPGIPFSLKDYLTSADETSRKLRNEKRGAINTKAVNILVRLNISNQSWSKIFFDFESIFTGA